MQFSIEQFISCISQHLSKKMDDLTCWRRKLQALVADSLYSINCKLNSVLKTPVSCPYFFCFSNSIEKSSFGLEFKTFCKLSFDIFALDLSVKIIRSRIYTKDRKEAAVVVLCFVWSEFILWGDLWSCYRIFEECIFFIKKRRYCDIISSALLFCPTLFSEQEHVNHQILLLFSCCVAAGFCR